MKPNKILLLSLTLILFYGCTEEELQLKQFENSEIVEKLGDNGEIQSANDSQSVDEPQSSEDQSQSGGDDSQTGGDDSSVSSPSGSATGFQGDDSQSGDDNSQMSGSDSSSTGSTGSSSGSGSTGSGSVGSQPGDGSQSGSDDSQMGGDDSQSGGDDSQSGGDDSQTSGSSGSSSGSTGSTGSTGFQQSSDDEVEVVIIDEETGVVLPDREDSGETYPAVCEPGQAVGNANGNGNGPKAKMPHVGQISTWNGKFWVPRQLCGVESLPAGELAGEHYIYDGEVWVSAGKGFCNFAEVDLEKNNAKASCGGANIDFSFRFYFAAIP